MKNRKNIRANIKIQIPSCMASPSPPIGPVLGQHGINIVEFCKIFNKQTESLEKGTIVPVVVTVFSDKSFSFIIKTPPASFLLKKAAGIQSGSKNPKEKVGKVKRLQIRKIAEMKLNDMTGSNIEAMSRSIEGTAISMGLEIVD